MVLGLVVVNLVDGYGGVDDRGLDGLLLDDGLNGLRRWLVSHIDLKGCTYLMNVMVDMLACNNRGHRVGLSGSSLDTVVSELSSLLFEAGLDGS